MIQGVEELIDLLHLEKLDKTLFRGHSMPTPWKRVFGGQVLGQALNAAYQTVPDDRICHSLHGYFILPGDIDHPILYQVDETRDGGSFTTRRVKAIQHGREIFVMAASFQSVQAGLDHQIISPIVTPAEKLKNEQEKAESIKHINPQLYQKIKNRTQQAIEFRPADDFILFSDDDTDIGRDVWMTLKQKKTLDIPTQHQIMAYTSDYDLLLTSVIPHRKNIDFDKLFIASLDHAMWFHRVFDLNEWLLFSMNSPSASNSRGMGYGSIFNQEGVLVATVMQEGLIRAGKRSKKT